MTVELPPGGNRYVLGVDLGTSECKICLITEAGEVVRVTRERYTTHAPRPLWAEQDPRDWAPAATAATRRLVAQTGIAARSIIGMALTSAAHIGVLLDAHGRPVRPAILWNDQRSSREAAELEREHGEEILRKTYQAVSTTWTLPHLCWVRRNDPDAWARTRRVALSKDFLVEWLVGSPATDPATALSSQLYDASVGRWSPELCAMAGVSPEMLPPVRPARDRIGGLTAEAAERLGLPPGTPVVVGTLDSATELFAAGAVAEGQCLVRLATAGGVQVVIRGPRPNRKLITYPHVVEPLWYCQAGTNACATSVRWGARLVTGEADVPFAAWDAWAAAAPVGAGGLLFHPYLVGERAPQWDPELRASFVGASLDHGRGHFARAIYEGTAYSIRHAMSVLPGIESSSGPLAVVGGGTQSAVWVQILANVLGRPLVVAEGVDSAYGAALLGLAGLGLSDGRAGAAATAARRRSIAPQPDCTAAYADRYPAYVRVAEALAPLYHQYWRGAA